MKTDAEYVLSVLYDPVSPDLLAIGGAIMLDSFVPLLAAFLDPEFMEWWLYPPFFGYFIASVPGLIRMFTKWG